MAKHRIKYMKSFFIGNIEIKVPVIQGGMGSAGLYTPDIAHKRSRISRT